MHWAKRKFSGANYGPYQDILGVLRMTNAQHASEFMMISRKEDASTDEVYVGVPIPDLLKAFDGFTPVEASAVPQCVDRLLVGDRERFKKRLVFRIDL